MHTDEFDNFNESCNIVDKFCWFFVKLPSLYKLAKHVEDSHIDEFVDLAKFCQIAKHRSQPCWRIWQFWKIGNCDECGKVSQIDKFIEIAQCIEASDNDDWQFWRMWQISQNFIKLWNLCKLAKHTEASHVDKFGDFSSNSVFV